MRLNLVRAVRALALSLLAAAALATPFSCGQPGCNVENCKILINDCRVEFVGMPSQIPECTGFDKPPSPPDWSKYCVDACNAHGGNGDLASCIATKKDACDANPLMTETAIAACLPQNPEKGPDPTCDDKCLAERTTCDTACSGGKPCDNCLRAGGTHDSCASVCTNVGWQACLDCSGRCGVAYVHCSDGCPRAP